MRAGVGITDNPKDRDAGREAASLALARSGPPVLALLLTTDNYDQQAVLKGVLQVLGRTRLVGACSAGLFSGDDFLDRGVGVLTLAGDELSAATALVPCSTDRARQAGVEVGEKLLAEDQDSGAIFCFPDGLSGNISQVLDGLYDTVGPGFHYGGGGTGDNLRLSRTWQFTEQGVNSNAVAGAFLGGCALATRIGHEWEPFGSPVIITNAKGRTVYELDGRPAFEVYSQRLGGIEEENFAQFAMRYPFGISYGPGFHMVRDPLKVVEKTAIEFVSEIPRRAVAYIMKPRENGPTSLAEELGRDCFGALKHPAFALISYCVSRSLILGEGCREELKNLLRPFGEGFPALGFLAFGEIGSTGGRPQLHNKSISVVIGGA